MIICLYALSVLIHICHHLFSNLQKAHKKPKDTDYKKKYEQDMKVMKEDLQELKQLLQMSIVMEEADEDSTATEAAYAETTQLKGELEELKLQIAEAYVQDEVDEEETEYLETTLNEVEAEVAEVEKVVEEKVKKEKAKKVEEAEVAEVETVLEETTDKKEKKKKGE